mmetsp:Transcript_137425/g.194461  ORF Transcript_137425/g.194461 Transcript_137425/m.194461 type:complete len:239 (-) Transcript_137425:17-733(-)
MAVVVSDAKQAPVAKVKPELKTVDLVDSDDDIAVVECSIVPAQTAKKELALKKEIKAEPKPQRRRTKKTKAVKVKKEKNKDAGEERSRSRPKEKKAAKNAAPESSSSESESSEELSEDTLYKLVKPYTKVMLVNLVRKAELNGMQGQVVHPSTAVCPCPPGCVLVRLETGREIAIKPKNLQMINSWQRGAHSYSQGERLKQVLKHIKHGSETVLASDVDSGAAILGKTSAQGGVGHAL